MKVKIENGRLRFPALVEPREQLNGGLKFDANIIISDETRIFIVKEDGTKVASTMDKVLLQVANDKWSGQGAKVLAAIENSKKCYRPGDTKLTKGGDVYDGFEGNHYVVAKNERRPRLVSQARTELVTPREILDTFYDGCHVDSIVDVFAMDKPGQGKGVFATLKGLQFRKHGDAFGSGGPASLDEFDEIEEEETADDLV